MTNVPGASGVFKGGVIVYTDEMKARLLGIDPAYIAQHGAVSREVAIANAEYIWYASPNALVYEDATYQEDMGEDAMAILYPDIESFRENYNRYAFRSLDAETLALLNTLWEEVKLN